VHEGKRLTYALGQVIWKYARVGLPFSVAVSFAACQKTPVDEPSFRKPTATEVFNLRTKCAEIGEKIDKENVFATPPMLMQDQVSHYDPKTGRCYVELTAHVNYVLLAMKPEQVEKYKDYLGRYVFDGQTGEMLASAVHQKGTKATVFLKDGPVEADYFAATDKMDTLMADPGKP
jgi:hypothetical protein